MFIIRHMATYNRDEAIREVLYGFKMKGSMALMFTWTIFQLIRARCRSASWDAGHPKNNIRHHQG